MRVLVFGDSNTQGFWDTEGGWVARVRRHYDEIQLQDITKDEPTIFNLGVSGDSSREVLNRFRSEAHARISQEMAVVFAVGVNDSRTKAGVPFTTPVDYRNNLEQLAAQARELTSRILFIGLTPCEEEITNPVPWGTSGYTNQRILLFEQVLQDFCQSNNFPVVDVFDILRQENQTQKLFIDGLHPNNAGHERLYELVYPALDKALA